MSVTGSIVKSAKSLTAQFAQSTSDRWSNENN